MPSSRLATFSLILATVVILTYGNNYLIVITNNVNEFVRIGTPTSDMFRHEQSVGCQTSPRPRTKCHTKRHILHPSYTVGSPRVPIQLELPTYLV